MSQSGQAGRPETAGRSPVDCHDLRVAVVAARWHPEIVERLLTGARRALSECRVEQPSVVRVEDCFDLAVVAKALAERGYEAVIALGVVVRGATPHFDFLCSAAAQGLSRVAADTGAAVGFGLLTCDTEEQALERVGGPAARVDTGYDATTSALGTAMTLRRIRRGYEPDDA